jgi:hypothetical protein
MRAPVNAVTCVVRLRIEKKNQLKSSGLSCYSDVAGLENDLFMWSKENMLLYMDLFCFSSDTLYLFTQY